jgi:SAM-dependent methyltransferase
LGIVLRTQNRFAPKTAAETFNEIYAKNLWGGKPGEFWSGDGSTAEFAVEYSSLISGFIRRNDVKTVVDIGCGDFAVASRFISDDIDYIGIDIVEVLIERNRRLFSSPNVRFEFSNVSESDPPDADLCLIRQVLQHLSNDEIAGILEKCHKFPFVIVTEHYPAPDRELIPNIDIPHGPGMRVYQDSAVVLDKPPFNVSNVSLLFDREGDEGTRLKTFLVDNRHGSDPITRSVSFTQ